MSIAAASDVAHEPEEGPLAPVEGVVRQVAQAFRALTSEETTKVLREAVTRSETLVAQAHRESVNGRAVHRAKGSPPMPPQPEREAHLARSTMPTPKEQLPERHAGELQKLGELASKTRTEIIANPLWIAANHVERSARFVSAEDLIRDDAELKKARDELGQAGDAVLVSKRALERHEAKPKWRQGAQDFLFQTGKQLRGAFDVASHHMLDVKEAAERVEREARWRHEATASEQNHAAQARQKLATAQRESLERPLRAALLERALAQTVITHGRPASHLRDAPANERLELKAVHSDRGFPVLEFRSTRGDIYLADGVEHDRELTPGDKVRFALKAHGARDLEVSARGPNRYLGDVPVEGRVAAAHWENGKLTKLELTEPRSQKPISILPRGTDLAAEIGGLKLRELEQGDSIRIQQGQGHLLSRSNNRSSQARGR